MLFLVWRLSVISPQRNDFLNKKVILIFSILISIGLIVGVFYLKVKNDKEKEIKQQYYDEQKQRITLYMKYNVKNIRKLLLQMLKRIL